MLDRRQDVLGGRRIRCGCGGPDALRFLVKFADGGKSDSLATRMRQNRFAHFNSLVEPLSRPLRILDVGGTQVFWERMGFLGQTDVEIVLLNVGAVLADQPNVTSVAGDARCMPEYADGEFDVVFSNSVIEHVGNFEEQRQMAEEVKRVGKRYFVQTPNRNFPIEPHFLFPYFQFLPLWAQVFLLKHFDMGWTKKIEDKEKAAEMAKSITLLTRREFTSLFPDAEMRKEKFLGMTKSFTACGGWDR